MLRDSIRARTGLAAAAFAISALIWATLPAQEGEDPAGGTPQKPTKPKQTALRPDLKEMQHKEEPYMKAEIHKKLHGKYAFVDLAERKAKELEPAEQAMAKATEEGADDAKKRALQDQIDRIMREYQNLKFLIERDGDMEIETNVTVSTTYKDRKIKDEMSELKANNFIIHKSLYEDETASKAEQGKGRFNYIFEGIVSFKQAGASGDRYWVRLQVTFLYAKNQKTRYNVRVFQKIPEGQFNEEMKTEMNMIMSKIQILSP